MVHVRHESSIHPTDGVENQPARDRHISAWCSTGISCLQMVAFFFALRSLETFSRICNQRLPGSRPVTVKFRSLSLNSPIYEKEEAVKAHSQSPASLLMSSRNSIAMAAFKYCCFLACYKRALRTLSPALFHPPHKARRALENFHKSANKLLGIITMNELF